MIPQRVIYQYICSCCLSELIPYTPNFQRQKCCQPIWTQPHPNSKFHPVFPQGRKRKLHSPTCIWSIRTTSQGQWFTYRPQRQLKQFPHPEHPGLEAIPTLSSCITQSFNPNPSCCRWPDSQSDGTDLPIICHSNKWNRDWLWAPVKYWLSWGFNQHFQFHWLWLLTMDMSKQVFDSPKFVLAGDWSQHGPPLNRDFCWGSGFDSTTWKFSLCCSKIQFLYLTLEELEFDY